MKDGFGGWCVLAVLDRLLERKRTREARTIRHIKGMRELSRLMVLLNSREPGVPEKAAEALGRLGDKRAIKPLLERLGDDNPFLDHAIAETLVRLGTPKKQLVEAYLGVLSKDTLNATDIRAVKALGKLGDKRAINPLLKRKKTAAKALASLVSKPYFSNDGPSIQEILIHAIDAALAQLQA